VYDDTIYNFCARARFAGCSYLRHIILGLNTVWLRVDNFFILRYMKGADLSTQVQQLQQLWNRGLLLAQGGQLLHTQVLYIGSIVHGGICR
jgi:hypothetical protein